MPFPMLLPLLLAGGGAAAGGAGAAAKNRENEQARLRNALDTEYSPWISPQQESVGPSSSVVGGALGGGLSGFSMGQGLQGGLSAMGGDAASKGMEAISTAPPTPSGPSLSPGTLSSGAAPTQYGQAMFSQAPALQQGQGGWGAPQKPGFLTPQLGNYAPRQPASAWGI